MLTQEQRDRIETRLTELADALRARQAGVLGARGRYHQLRRGAWDRWAEYQPSGAGLAAWVDEYDGPAGKGYVLCLEATAGDRTRWQRRVNVGPEAESHQGHGWQRLESA